MSSRSVVGAGRPGPELLEKGEKGKPDKEGKGRWAGRRASLIELVGPRGKKGSVKPAEGPRSRGQQGEGWVSDLATARREGRVIGPDWRGG